MSCPIRTYFFGFGGGRSPPRSVRTPVQHTLRIRRPLVSTQWISFGHNIYTAPAASCTSIAKRDTRATIHRQETSTRPLLRTTRLETSTQGRELVLRLLRSLF